jgi:SecD/SecF fusion protein
MNRTLWAKILLIAGTIFFAFLFFWPPNKTLQSGIDLAGGTSLIYEIDATGLTLSDRRELSTRMIDVLRRRIDPGNIRNLIWRPQGDTRFEIQMPLANAEARSKRQEYENARNILLKDNINPALIMKAIKQPAEQRAEYFKKIAAGSAARTEVLNSIAKAYDNYYNLRKQSEDLDKAVKSLTAKIAAAGIDPNKQARSQVYSWSLLDEAKREQQLRKFISPKDPNKVSPEKVELLKSYVKTFSDWAQASEQLVNPDKGPAAEYKEAQKKIEKLNLTEERITTILSIENSGTRKDEIKKLKADFPEQAQQIDTVIAAYEGYKPFQGRLDDPKDLQRMLKGSGILEFRILPTDSPTAEKDKILTYIERLRSNGPSYISSTDNEYIWLAVESTEELFTKDKNGNPYIKWRDSENNPVYAEIFGGKWYVLASNKPEECMLHSSKSPWKLKKSTPGRDPQRGRRAIDFELDTAGGEIFARITAANINRPLCILLDNLAISAPNINTRIYTNGQITGTFTDTQQVDMVNKLNAGTLPARLIEPPISERTIGPSIGADNRDKGIKSGLIGVILVILCMAIYYTVGGCIADAALLLNLLFTLAIMAFLRATFTLPGIAGLILTIGMSVDANVLIFERMREEQQKGASLRTAIKNGYEKAFSAIFDSNLTTIISAVVLYWVGSEDIKGFAIVLIIGLLSNLFTAVFVTRVVFDFLLAKGIMKNQMIMLNLIRKPKINWMAYRPLFFTISAILTIGGLAVFFTRDNTRSNKYDIEFTGGTSVIIDLKEGSQLTRQDVEDRIKKVGAELANPAITTSNIWSIGKSTEEKAKGEKIFNQYEITTIETNKSIVKATFPAGQNMTVKAIVEKITDRLTDAVVNTTSQPNVFEISSSQTNTVYVSNVIKESFPNSEITDTQVQQTVNEAIIKAFGNDLKILQSLEPQITSSQQITDKLIESEPQLIDFIGGIKITCSLKRQATVEEISSRFEDLRFKPDTQNLPMYNHKFLASDLTTLPANQAVTSFVYVSSNEDFAFRQPNTDEWNKYEDTEKTKVTTSMQLTESLPRVTQISPSVGAEAKTRALLAIILSLIALLIYIWFRFGSVRYGLGAVITLFHDTCVTLGLISVATYIAATNIGQALLIGDFKINLAMIAAILTLIGYSLNDSIVIYDRIRENRKKGTLTPQLISDSINDTLSRTLLTGGTTLIVVWIMYIFGGEALRGFNYTMGLGIIVGTYSSIAISAPVLLFGRRAKAEENKIKS